MCGFRFLTAMIAVCFLCLEGHSLEVDKSSFLAEYRSHAESLAAQASGPLTIVARIEKHGANARILSAYYLNGLIRSEVTFDKDGKSIPSVFCFNKEAIFTVARIGTEKYVLESFKSTKAGSKLQSPSREFDGNLLRAFYDFRNHYYVASRPLLERLEDPATRFLGQSQVIIDGNDCVEITFDNPSEEGDSTMSVALDPALNWKIRRSSFRLVDGKRMEQSVSYRRSDTKMPTSSILACDGKTVLKIEFHDWDFSSLEEGPFTLKHYGLDAIQPRESPFRVWIFAFVLLLACIVFGLWNNSQQKRAS